MSVNRNGSECRGQIVRDFARWTTLSALRQAPIRSRATVYPALDAVRFGEVLLGSDPITTAEFDTWHERETRRLSKTVIVGWGAKLLNIYLKTAGYVGGLGRPGLTGALHPPIDRGLWQGVRQWSQNSTDTLDDIVDDLCCVDSIKDIDYATYRRIIHGCRRAAAKLHCQLIEVEQLWVGSATPTPTRRT